MKNNPPMISAAATMCIHRRATTRIALANMSTPSHPLHISLPSSVNHLTRQAEAQPRRVLDESARIARGKIVDLATLRADDLDALLFPGGFGAAKNLSTFVDERAQCRVNDQVERI